jgi:iron complex transport system ATP-binding protein
LLGLLPMQSGQVLMDGADLRARKRAEVAREVSYVPQAHAAFFPFTVREVVLMGRTAHLGVFSTPSRNDHDMAIAALERMGLAHLADSVYTRISGGERQLTLVARALAQDAHIVVMDEPTANLDFGNQVRVLEHVQALARGGIGVLLSTHDPDQAFVCADRVALLHQGRLVRLGAPAEVITAESLREIYGVEVAVASIQVGAGKERPVCVPLGSSPGASGGRG